MCLHHLGRGSVCRPHQYGSCAGISVVFWRVGTTAVCSPRVTREPCSGVPSAFASLWWKPCIAASWLAIAWAGYSVTAVDWRRFGIIFACCQHCHKARRTGSGTYHCDYHCQDAVQLLVYQYKYYISDSCKDLLFTNSVCKHYFAIARVRCSYYNAGSMMLLVAYWLCDKLRLAWIDTITSEIAAGNSDMI